MDIPVSRSLKLPLLVPLEGMTSLLADDHPMPIVLFYVHCAFYCHLSVSCLATPFINVVATTGWHVAIIFHHYDQGQISSLEEDGLFLVENWTLALSPPPPTK